ncbi:hypothetical protein M7I_6940 [Glarea lozoyensis 74030]|uniref:Uncharacterized protein n=1 Tax=Glarea lozoyensis (strain ATCC 74030 / MF5533) TaxID=1104152 RepID=H0EVY3_GLAL7|nr:hypothetical protein M7I_6940 [Glarea lozoyensis 74030]
MRKRILEEAPALEKQMFFSKSDSRLTSNGVHGCLAQGWRLACVLSLLGGIHHRNQKCYTEMAQVVVQCIQLFSSTQARKQSFYGSCVFSFAASLRSGGINCVPIHEHTYHEAAKLKPASSKPSHYPTVAYSNTSYDASRCSSSFNERSNLNHHGNQASYGCDNGSCTTSSSQSHPSPTTSSSSHNSCHKSSEEPW